MNLEEAMKTAIQFENKVFATYQQAQDRAEDPIGKRIFQVLAQEEQEHIAYLGTRLAEWQKTGRLNLSELKTAIPAATKIKQEESQLKQKVGAKVSATEIELLQLAIEAEQQTSSFYERMVKELSAEGQALFARFVEIEKGHLAIVQAEMDSVKGLGFWFDMQEFSLEAE
jgi:rubrerythrin